MKDTLEAQLQVKVRAESEADRSSLTLPVLTPVLPETGEVGVSISLGRFREEDDGYWHVNVTIARSGLDSTIVDYVLERREAGWTIVHPAPNEQGEGSLDARIRAADQAEAAEGHPDLGPTISLLDESVGDLETTFYILENMYTWQACRWRLAAVRNPDHIEEVCDRMVETLSGELREHEIDACFAGEGCLIR